MKTIDAMNATIHHLYAQLQAARGNQAQFERIFDLYIAAIARRDAAERRAQH